jgi:sulfite reductase alpha subunit-like flavoprotein
MACVEIRDALRMVAQSMSLAEGLEDWYGRNHYGRVPGDNAIVLPMLNGLEDKLNGIADKLKQMQKMASALEMVALHAAPVFCKLLVDVIDEPETDIIVMATGKGIAPMRAWGTSWRSAPTRDGSAWLFLGVDNPNLLYIEDWKKMEEEHPGYFRFHLTWYRDEPHLDHKGPHWYHTLYHKVEEYGDEILQCLDKGAHIYFCGHKGMMPGILCMLEKAAYENAIPYEEFVGKMMNNGQWHYELY